MAAMHGADDSYGALLRGGVIHADGTYVHPCTVLVARLFQLLECDVMPPACAGFDFVPAFVFEEP